MPSLYLKKLITIIIPILALFTLASCSEDVTWKSTQEAVAKSAANIFMLTYYVDDNLGMAQKLSTGMAHEKITGELKVVEQSGNVQKLDDQEPVNYLLTGTEVVEKGKFIFIWKVHSETGKSLSSKITMILNKEKWLVSKIEEAEL